MPTPVEAAPPPPSKDQQQHQLPAELQELVQELALAVHKRGIYPASHPMLRGSVDALARRFGLVLAKRSQLSLGVSRRRLIVDGIATDESNPLVADLAERLYAHELGIVSFRADLEARALEEFIAAIAVSPARAGEPLGAAGRSQLARWSDIALTRVAFDRLELMGDRTEESEREAPKAQRFEKLWLGLARAALGGESLDGALEDPKRLAESIDRHFSRERYDQAILSFLRQIIGELGDGEMRDTALRQRVSDLVKHLDDATLSTLLRMGGDAPGERPFSSGRASRLLPVPSST